MRLRRLLASAVVLAALSLALPAVAGEVVTEDIVYGGFYSTEWESGADALDLGAAAGQKVTFIGTFHDIAENDAFTAGDDDYYNPAIYSNTKTLLDNAWAGQATPFANLSIPATAAAIAGGSWDTNIDQFASHVEAFLDQGGGRSLIIAPLQEMNGEWVPYGCDPTNFETAFIKIRTIFRNRGMDETQLRFAFAPNGVSDPGCGSIADYYPGDAYVDVNAFSAYNFGAGDSPPHNDNCVNVTTWMTYWETVAAVMTAGTEALKAVAPLKPIIIAQTAAPRSGCGATTQNGGQNQWVRDLFTFAAGDSNVVGIIWFNFNKISSGETDWRIWDGTTATQGWIDGMNLDANGLQTRYAWPLTEWFQPGALLVTPPPGPCPDGSTCDTAVFVKPSGQWFRHSALGSADPVNSFWYGNPGDFPFTGDWDCDGVKTPGLYRQSDGFVYLRNSNTQGVADITFFFGNPGDVPVAGDFDEDGCDTVSIYRPSEGRFYIMNQLGENGGGLGAADYAFWFGNPYDNPFVGDFDGDGQDSIGLYRVTTGFVYFRNTLDTGVAHFSFFYGDPGDKILAGDWDGDGDDTVGVYRPSSGKLYLNFENAQGNADYTVYVGSYFGAARG